MLKKFEILVFRASENEEKCREFISGHVKILEDYGITNVSTNEASWINSKDVYVLSAYERNSGEIVGGLRIHLRNDKKLPIQKAIEDLDNRINWLIENEEGIVGEICGMWNSRKYFGYGISAILGRASVAYAKLLGVDKLFCLAAKYILDLAKLYGFEIVEEIGNKGTFPYPIESHLAHVLRLEDIESLPSADQDQKMIMDEMRRNISFSRIENSVKGEYVVEYKPDERLFN